MTAFSLERAPGIPAPPPPPENKKKKMEGREELPSVEESFKNFNLLEQFREKSYDEVRVDLAKLQYAELVDSAGAYEQAVNRLEARYAKMPAVPQPALESISDVSPFLKGVAERVKGKSRSEGGVEQMPGGSWGWSYGAGPRGKAVTSLYINPRIERTEEVMQLVDEALADCNAQIKLYPDAFMGEVENPSARPDNKMVVYFGDKDTEGMTRFLQRLDKVQGELLPRLKPETLQSDMATFRIPVAPGITFAERDGSDSWDYTARAIQATRDQVGDLIKKWNANGVPPTVAEWKRDANIKWWDVKTRNRRMPGLRARE